MKKLTILLVIAWCIVGLFFCVSSAFAEEVFEKDGCVYIIGSPTSEEIARDNELYTQRRTRIREMYEATLEANLKISLAEINAQALENYLEAQALTYGNLTVPQDNINISNNTTSNAKNNLRAEINTNNEVNTDTRNTHSSK